MNKDVLTVLENKGRCKWVSWESGEIHTVCPITKHADFCKVYINYIPSEKLIEHVTLGKYLRGFVDEPILGEDFADRLLGDLMGVFAPLYMEVRVAYNMSYGIKMSLFVNDHTPNDGSMAALAAKRHDNYGGGGEA